MKSPTRVALACLGLPAALGGWSGTARAAVPAGYTGTPYQGTAQQIPGRVELANLDEGGLNVAFFADHRRENAVGDGYSPISGDDYRPGNLNLPNICKTNKSIEVPGQGSEDFWEDGTRYPSEAEKYTYYMGYAHTVDWVRVTVDVKQAGTYNVSSSWACANPKCGLSIWFNDGASKIDNPHRPLDGENKSGIVMLDGTNDYHKWRAYPNFAQVKLNAGVQLMTFNLEVADHLQYGFLKFELVGGGGEGTGGAGAGGAAGATSAAAGTSALPGAGSGPVASAGTGGAAGSSTGPTGGVAQAPAGSSGASSAGTATSGLSSNEKADAGCALVPGTGAPSAWSMAGLALAASLWLRRRGRLDVG